MEVSVRVINRNTTKKGKRLSVVSTVRFLHKNTCGVEFSWSIGFTHMLHDRIRSFGEAQHFYDIVYVHRPSVSVTGRDNWFLSSVT